MALTTITGTISNLQFSTETTGSMNKGSGSIQTNQSITFRLNDSRSVLIKLPSRPDIAEGETVTVAGTDKGGQFVGLAVRNDKTGTIFMPSTLPLFIGGGVALLLGFMTLIIILGIFILPIGAYMIYLGYRYTQAGALLRN